MAGSLTARFAAEGLQAFRGHTLAVHGVSFTVQRGEWLGLVGANGSGKTTLLRAMCGRLPIAAGRLLIDGIDCTDDRACRAASIGFAPDPSLLPNELTPAELFAIIADDPRAQAPGPPLRDLWRALTLDRFIDRKIGTFSAGTRQRIAIYSAFLGHSDGAVILDEPFNWLDPLTAYDTREAFQRLVENGLTLITALHDIATLTIHCDRGILLSEGKLSLTLDAQALAAGKHDAEAFDRMIVDHLRPASPQGQGQGQVGK